eukprot:8801001-Heterocapsa_arctica.AAC.1
MVCWEGLYQCPDAERLLGCHIRDPGPCCLRERVDIRLEHRCQPAQVLGRLLVRCLLHKQLRLLLLLALPARIEL